MGIVQDTGFFKVEFEPSETILPLQGYSYIPVWLSVVPFFEVKTQFEVD
jgi:hypothetical protein